MPPKASECRTAAQNFLVSLRCATSFEKLFDAARHPLTYVRLKLAVSEISKSCTAVTLNSWQVLYGTDVRKFP